MHTRQIPHRGAPFGLPVLIWAVWLALMTLYPLRFGGPDSAQPFAAMLFEHDLGRRGPDILLNTLLFVPLGAWVHAEGRRHSRSPMSMLLLAGVSGVLLSLAIESLQLFLPTRFPSVVDVAANAAGALAGVFAHRVLAAPATRLAASIRARMTTGRALALIAVFTVAALGLSAALQSRSRLSNWSLDYPLMVGNERTGNRPWQGRVFLVALTDAAMPVSLVRRFADGGAPALAGRRVAVFDFSGNGPYKDGAARTPALAWTGRMHDASDEGVPITPQAWLESEEPAAELARRLRESNAFTLRVVCAAFGPIEGRGRIVSNSLNIGERNFSLEQSGRDLIFRWRTPHTGENASHPEATISNAFVDRSPRDILVTYDGATLHLAIADSGAAQAVKLTPGSSLVSLWANYLPVQNLPMYEFGYLALVFVPLGALVCVLTPAGMTRIACGGASVLGCAVALEGTLAAVSGRSFAGDSVGLAAGVGALAFGLAATNLSLFLDTETAPAASFSPSAHGLQRPESE